MRKAIFLIVILMLVTTILFGCATDQQATGKEDNPPAAPDDETPAETETPEPTWKVFTSDEHGFTINYPGSWIIVDTSRYPVVFRPNENTQTTFYVETHTSMFADRTHGEYVNEMMSKIKRIRDTADFQDTVEIEINEHPFTVLEYTMEAEGSTYYYVDYFTSNGHGFILRYVITDEDLETVEEVAEEMVMSFEFTN